MYTHYVPALFQGAIGEYCGPYPEHFIHPAVFGHVQTLTFALAAAALGSLLLIHFRS
jgi:hypothetical protein